MVLKLSGQTACPNPIHQGEKETRENENNCGHLVIFSNLRSDSILVCVQYELKQIHNNAVSLIK